MRASLALVLAFGIFCACSRGPDAASAPAETTVLLRGNGPEPDSLDPQKARTNEAQTILRDICEPLTSLGRDASTVPGAARAWRVGEDGRTYTFELRRDARWSNGDRLVAEDFVAALRRLVDPATASQYAQVVDVIANAPAIVAGKADPQTLGVAAPDESTVVITLTAPAPYLPGLLAHPSTCPAHRPTLAQHAAAFAKPGVTVSNGAFVLTEWIQGVHVTAERNRRYWNDAATRIDAVRYLHIADENAELARYRAGALHVTNAVPRGQFDWIMANLADELRIGPQLNTYYYGFNLDREPFRSRPGLRRALSLVVDRERLAQSVLRVGELPANGWVPPGIHDYGAQSFDYTGRPMSERIAEARRLYAAAGYTAARPLTFELRYNAGEVHNKLAVAVSSMWREALGVDAKLAAVEFKSLLQDIDTRAVDVFRSSWLGDYNDAYTFLQYLKSDFGINLPRYANPAYDALLVKAAAETDSARRRAYLEEAERTMLADHPLIPLYFYVNKHLVKPQLRGWYDNVMNVVYSKDLSLTAAAR
ncbi:MAG: peptide ABC transporter substrate-binding protein [Gammaproteobacteria bacterium]